MVATRHRGLVEEEEDIFLDPNDRKQSNMVKKLAIEGKPTMRGEKKLEDKKIDTYHHRGASYLLTDFTPQTFIDNEPSRYKKRKFDMFEDDEDESDEDKIVRGPVRKRARALSVTEAKDLYQPQTRRSEPLSNTLSTFDGHDSGEDEYTPKRTRRNMPEVYYGRPRRQMGDSTNITPRKRRRTRADSPDLSPQISSFDYTDMGGEDYAAIQEHAKLRAKLKGYEASPITEEFIQQNFDSADEQAALQLVMTLGRINSQLERLDGQLKEADKRLEACRELHKQERPVLTAMSQVHTPEELADEARWETHRMELEARDAGFEWKADEEEILETPAARSPSPRTVPSPEKTEEVQEPTPPSEHSKSPEHNAGAAEEDSIEIPTNRHDSAAELTEAALSKVPADESLDTLILPDTNNAGQRLRWSLPKNLTDPERAERSIYYGRLENESRTGKRRRVKREEILVRTWKERRTETSKGSVVDEG